MVLGTARKRPPAQTRSPKVGHRPQAPPRGIAQPPAPASAIGQPKGVPPTAALRLKASAVPAASPQIRPITAPRNLPVVQRERIVRRGRAPVRMVPLPTVPRRPVRSIQAAGPISPPPVPTNRRLVRLPHRVAVTRRPDLATHRRGRPPHQATPPQPRPTVPAEAVALTAVAVPTAVADTTKLSFQVRFQSPRSSERGLFTIPKVGKGNHAASQLFSFRRVKESEASRSQFLFRHWGNTVNTGEAATSDRVGAP